MTSKYYITQTDWVKHTGYVVLAMGIMFLGRELARNNPIVSGITGLCIIIVAAFAGALSLKANYTKEVEERKVKKK